MTEHPSRAEASGEARAPAAEVVAADEALAALACWEPPHRALAPEALRELAARLAGTAAPAGVEAARAAALAVHAVALAAWIARRRTRPGLFVLGLNGAQGSGKSTLAGLVRTSLATDFGLRARVLSLDDLYLTRAARADLAATVHPLLATRGVPGTHDLPLAEAVLDALAAPRPPADFRLPRFDKAIDDRRPYAEGEAVQDATDVLVLEGWCVGAGALDAAALRTPINALEREEDADGRWRRHVAAALAGPYRSLFERLDALVMLAIPDFSLVRRWRGNQEARLRETRGLGMSPAQVDRFVAHYERITREQLVELPQRADLVLRLDPEQRVTRIHGALGAVPASQPGAGVQP